MKDEMTLSSAECAFDPFTSSCADPGKVTRPNMIILWEALRSRRFCKTTQTNRVMKSISLEGKKKSSFSLDNSDLDAVRQFALFQRREFADAIISTATKGDVDLDGSLGLAPSSDDLRDGDRSDNDPRSKPMEGMHEPRDRRPQVCEPLPPR